MNIWGKKERSWRRKNRRGVSPIIATILLVAITVVLAAVLYILIQQYTKSGNAVTIGSALAIGGSTDGSSSTINYYNMTVEEASSTLTLGSFTFEVKSPTGAVVSTGTLVTGTAVTALSVVVISPLGGTIATYTPGAATTYAAHCTAPTYNSACSSTSPMTTQYTFSVQISPVGCSLSGYTLVALGQGSFSGTTPGTIT
jgi:flagellin-like protein